MGWKINYDVFFLVSLFSLITWKITLSMEKFMQKEENKEQQLLNERASLQWIVQINWYP